MKPTNKDSTDELERLIDEYVLRWYLPDERDESELQKQDDKSEMKRQLKAIALTNKSQVAKDIAEIIGDDFDIRGMTGTILTAHSNKNYLKDEQRQRAKSKGYDTL